MVRISRVVTTLAVAAVLVSACTTKKTERPSLTGPSELALSLSLAASPDVLAQDGSSQSQLVVQARDANGQPAVNVPVRIDISVNNVVQDFGKLSTRTLVTGSDGRATATYTAPTWTGGAGSSGGTTVELLVTPTGTDYASSLARKVSIQLLPPGLVPQFSYSPEPALVLVPITFTAPVCQPRTSPTDPAPTDCVVTDQPLTSLSWDFGDGGTATGATVTHTFRTAGTFKVWLTVVDAVGRTAKTSQSMDVLLGSLPTAAFVYSPSSPLNYQNVVFNASTSQAGSGRKLVGYTWDFSTGPQQQGMTVTKSFDTAGTYKVTLTVTDDAGQTATTFQSVTVLGGGLTAAFTTNAPTPTYPGDLVGFDASTSTSQAGITSYVWDFGDGSHVAAGRTQSHAYAAAGTYTVTLTVYDSAGHSADKTSTVTVAPYLTASFTLSPSSTQPAKVVLFDGSQSTGQLPITTYAWNFGDGSTATGRSSTHIYGAPGIYFVTLTIYDGAGHSATMTKSITVTP